MKKHDGISKYKLNKIAAESLRNSIRLHFDSILLYENGSYPSAFQLSVWTLEVVLKSHLGRSLTFGHLKLMRAIQMFSLSRHG